MNNLKITLTVLYLSASSLYASDFLLFNLAREKSMGGASVSLRHTMNAPSSLSKKDKISLYMSYSNDYGLKELSTYRFALVLPHKWLETRLLLSRFGYSVYNETLASLNLSKQLTQSLSLGVRFDYYAITIPEHELCSSLCTEMALDYSPLQQLNCTIHLINPFQSYVSLSEEKFSFSAIYRIGCSYLTSSDWLVSIEMQKQELEGWIYKLGIEYYPKEYLPLRIGLQGKPFAPSLGIGFLWNQIAIDSSFAWHTLLGIHSSLSFSVCF